MKASSSGQGCHADDSGRTDDRTMASRSSVTWMHCSVRYEVTWDKILASVRMRWRPRRHVRVRTDTHMHPLGRQCIRAMDAKGFGETT
jgi:hypothetical protein